MERKITLLIGFFVGYALMLFPSNTDFLYFLNILFDTHNLEFFIREFLKFIGFLIVVWSGYFIVLELFKNRKG